MKKENIEITKSSWLEYRALAQGYTKDIPQQYTHKESQSMLSWNDEHLSVSFEKQTITIPLELIKDMRFNLEYEFPHLTIITKGLSYWIDRRNTQVLIKVVRK